MKGEIHIPTALLSGPQLHDRLHDRACMFTLRHGAPARLVDNVAELTCPACEGPIFAPRDSFNELIDCTSCTAQLVTRRTASGAVAVALKGTR